jgi:plastocyanin
MKRVVIRVSDNYSLDSAAAAILRLYGYLTFVESFRSFSIITFDCPEKYSSGLLDKLNALGPVKKCTWDADDKFSTAPDDSATLTVETSGTFNVNTTGETSATTNTRNLTTSGSGTIYVKVQSINGQDLFVFASSPGGTYSVIPNQVGFAQGGTYTFDQSDASNANHPFKFSETPDGTHLTGGTEYTTGVTISGTPGTNGQTVWSVGQSTASILFYYCPTHSGMGRYQSSPINRYGTVNVHDYWHLDRITKQDRQYLNRTFSYTQSGDGVDIYVIDTGVRGASRPTGNNAALHPELYDPDFVTDLNGSAEQQNYRVFQLSHYAGSYGSNNEDDNGHGTYCAILAAGRTAGVSRKAKIYALKAFDSSNSGSYSAILSAYQAVIDHNDSGNGNYKGNTRPAIINASFGPTIPSQSYPYVELNDVGSDNNIDEEMLDDIEGTISSSHNIIVVRAAGNGFKNSSDQFVGPIQTKMISGSRTAGYPDNTNGGVNNVDADQKKICVGASEYNDRWADFSNYGAGVTTVAPGARILSPSYDWTANTPYTSTFNYTTISGTSFSCPLVTGIIAAYCSKNGFTSNTNNLAGNAKTFARIFGATGNISVMAHSNYPTNSIEDKKLIDNPYETLSGSNQLIIKFNPSDSSHFIGNVGRKVQLRATGSTAGAGSSTPTTYDITTTSPSSSYYTLSGADRNGSVSGNNAGVGVLVGDTINFNLSNVSSIHPFYIRVSSQGSNVTTPTASGQGSTGNATVSWTPNTAGTYYYQCGIHPGMIGTITVSNATGGAGAVIVGGINVSTLAQSGWQTIQAENAVNNTITVFAPNNATAGTTGGGSNNYLALIKSEELTHESYDGVVSTSTTLRSQTDAQEGAGSGSYDDVVYYPVDSGVDFNYAGTGSTLTTKRGAFFPFIDTNVSWARSSGAIATYNNGDSVSIDLGLSGTTFASEPTLEVYALSGDAIGSSGLSLDTSTGILSGTVTSDYIDTTFNFTVTEQITENAQAYSFTTTGTGVIVTITQQPSNASVEAGSGNTASFGPVFGISSDGSTIIYRWEFSSNGGVGWSPLTDGGGYSGTSTNTLTVDDDFAKNDYQFRCKLDTSTAVAPSYTNAVTLTVNRVITISNQPVNSNPMAPASGSFTVAGSTLDGATIAYQWEKSENGDGVNFSNISGANSATYTTGATTYDDDYGDYYRCVLSATGASSVTSNAAQNLVQRSINITSQPTNTTGAVGGTRSFGVAATTSDSDPSAITFQWQVSITNGASWSNVSTGTGGTTSTYTTETLTTTQDEYQYRCLLSATGATTIPSNAATLQVETVTIVITNDTNADAVNEGEQATFTVLGTTSMQPVGGNAASSSFDTEQFDTPAGGGGGGFEGFSDHSPTVTYQWEKTDDGNKSVVVTVGADTVGGQATGVFYFDGVEKPASFSIKRGATYTFDQSASSNANYNSQEHPLMFSTGSDGDHNGNGHYMTGVTYRLDGAVVTMAGYVSGFGTATSRTVTWNVDSNAASTLYYWCHYHTGQGNSLALTDQNWTTIGGATSNSYTTGACTYADDHQDMYRCVLSAVGAIDVTTSSGTLIVFRTYSITAQPSNPTANEGATASFSISTTSSSGTPTYQWERSDDNGSNYTTVVGATNSTYTTPTLVHANDDEDRYRCVVSLAGSLADVFGTTPLISNHGLLTVLRVISISQQPVDTGVIEGQSATLSITASITSDIIVYQWQKSTDNGNNWSNINGANSSSYTTPATVFPTTPSEQFRCVLSNAEATTVTSTAATVTVNESEFVSGPATVTPFIDPDTTKTLSRRPVITTSAFIQEYAGSTHASSFWRIRRVSDNVTVYDTIASYTNGDTGNLTSFTVPETVLDFDTTYQVQVKFRDQNGLESAYTPAVNFTTPFVDQPEIQVITPAFNPTINVDPIAVKSGYSHTSSDWQFAETTAFSPPVHQSLGNPTNLTSYTLPVNVTLSANTTYYVRIRFNVNPI